MQDLLKTAIPQQDKSWPANRMKLLIKSRPVYDGVFERNKN